MLSKSDFANEKIEVKDSGETVSGKPVFVREMDVKAFDECKARNLRNIDIQKTADGKTSTKMDTQGLHPYVLIRTICDESGKLVFDPASKEDLAIVSALPSQKMAKIFDAAWELNGFTDDAIEDAEKN